MSFTSLAFVFFLCAMVALFYVTPGKWRWLPLLIGSCYFYMAFVPKYILILFALILIDFYLAQRMECTQGHTRKVYLCVSILSNIGILFVFKYFNFFNENLSALAHFLHWNYAPAALSLLLPLGLSFHTFQSLSYTIEVYRGKYPAEHHLGIYALYVMFFPQLVAGPIERPAHLLEQLKRLDTISLRFENLWSGMWLMIWGFFKKLVIADRLAIAVDYVWNNFAHLPGPSIVIAAFLFTIQLYTDFSGYSDIARGAARMLGVDVVRNFEQPFFSRSTSEFWRRWHISLSTWFRDYFFYPIAYARRRVSREWLYACIFITFIVTGLWHGAGWHYVIMGALFGGYIVVGLVTEPWRKPATERLFAKAPRLHAALQMITVFTLATLADIFFRAPSATAGFQFIARMTSGWNIGSSQFVTSYFTLPFTALGWSRSDTLIAISMIVIVFVVEYIEQIEPLRLFMSHRSLLVRSFLYTGLVLSLILFGEFAAATAFIYFQF